MLCAGEHGSSRGTHSLSAPAAPQLPIPAVGSRQTRTSRRRQHFSAPGQLWSDRQYLLVGRVGLLPTAGHTPALLGAGRAAGGRWPLCARCGGGLAAGPLPRSPRCCWAGAGGSSVHRARSSSTRAQVLGIVLLGLLWHCDCQSVFKSAGGHQPMAARFQGCGSTEHEQFVSRETPRAVLGSQPMAGASPAALPFQVTGDPQTARPGDVGGAPQPCSLCSPMWAPGRAC